MLEMSNGVGTKVQEAELRKAAAAPTEDAQTRVRTTMVLGGDLTKQVDYYTAVEPNEALLTLMVIAARKELRCIQADHSTNTRELRKIANECRAGAILNELGLEQTVRQYDEWEEDETVTRLCLVGQTVQNLVTITGNLEVFTITERKKTYNITVRRAVTVDVEGYGTVSAFSEEDARDPDAYEGKVEYETDIYVDANDYDGFSDDDVSVCVMYEDEEDKLSPQQAMILRRYVEALKEKEVANV